MAVPTPSSSIRSCCRCLVLIVVTIVIIVLTIVFFVSLEIRPKKPSFDLNTVSVSASYLLQPQQPQSAASLALNLTFLFTAVNTNKLHIRYDHSLFNVMYHGVPLGVASVPGFEQPAHSNRLVSAAFGVSRFDVMKADMAVDDRMELRIVVVVGAKARVVGITSERVQVAVDCAIVISPRKQSLTYKHCGVDELVPRVVPRGYHVPRMRRKKTRGRKIIFTLI